ncbi:MAG TPA: redoxin domain-containing protein [Gemmatimonadales bacterium]
MSWRAVALAMLCSAAPLAAQDSGAVHLRLSVEQGVHAGRQAPPIVIPYATRDSAGPASQPFDLSKELGHVVVVVFYPGDAAPGAADDWRAILSHEGALAVTPDMVLVGISADPLPVQVRFAADLALPFKLLSDKNWSVTRRYGALRGKAARPMLIVVGRDGQVRYVDDQFAPRDAATWTRVDAAIRAARGAQ